MNIFYNILEGTNNKQYFLLCFIINKEKFCLLIFLDENDNVYRIDWNTIDIIYSFKQIDLYALIFDSNLLNIINKIFFETNPLEYFNDGYTEKIFYQVKKIVKQKFNELQIPA